MGIVKRCFPHQLELLEKKVDMLQRQKRLSDRLQVTIYNIQDFPLVWPDL